MIFRAVSLLAVFFLGRAYADTAALECTDWQTKHPEWLWCDDFESDDTLERDYFDVQRVNGRFGVVEDAAFGGVGSLRSVYARGEENAGTLKLSLGATPVEPKRYTDRKFDNVYWRFYMQTKDGFKGNAEKITRATIITSSKWSQAAIGHLWDGYGLNLSIDPATGVSGSQVVTRRWNDFPKLRWLGFAEGKTEVYATENLGRWLCIEVHMKLNSPNRSDGEFAFWIDDELEASRSGLDWRGGYTEYGINAISLESWTNDGAPQEQARYFDNFVVSTERIGCYEDSDG
jgi:hypothetical protein